VGIGCDSSCCVNSVWYFYIPVNEENASEVEMR